MKIILGLLTSLILISCNPKKSYFLDINLFHTSLSSFNAENKNVCKINSMLFEDDFMNLIKRQSGQEKAEKLYAKIMKEEKIFKPTKITLNFNHYDYKKNHTLKWGHLMAILNNDEIIDELNFFYVATYIKGTQYFLEFEKNNNLFNKKIISFINEFRCEYPMK